MPTACDTFSSGAQTAMPQWGAFSAPQMRAMVPVLRYPRERREPRLEARDTC